METTSLLVIGAGPYGAAVAARALEAGIDTLVVGRPMSFWREHMPSDMFLRSGTGWHLDASGVHTFETFVEERGLDGSELDPIPISVFLDYADWFVASKHLVVDERLVAHLDRPGEHFEATLEDGSRIGAERVVAAPGNGYFRQLPPWSGKVPSRMGAHTCDFVHFGDVGGSRVLIVGGRQSAYEWAALVLEHGAERVDVVHRHVVPRFDRVSWSFVDEHMEATVAKRGWWRSLPASEQRSIAQRFWEVGRLTLEWWLTPRLASERLHVWPGSEVVGVAAATAKGARVTLSNGEHLEVDRVVFATGYKVELSRVAYLVPILASLRTDDGYPALDEAFQSSVPGFYLPGFAATRDFGPFFGFTRACPVAASLIVQDLLAS